MPHFSIRTLSIRMRHRAAVAGFALLPLALACQSMAQTPNGTADPTPQLKSSPVLEPPPPKALRLAPGANPLAPEREPIFLRAGPDRAGPATNDAVEKLNKTYTRKVDQMPAKEIVDEIDAKVSQEKLEAKLMEEGTAKFADPQHALLKLVAEKRAALATAK